MVTKDVSVGVGRSGNTNPPIGVDWQGFVVEDEPQRPAGQPFVQSRPGFPVDLLPILDGLESLIEARIGDLLDADLQQRRHGCAEAVVPPGRVHGVTGALVVELHEWPATRGQRAERARVEELAGGDLLGERQRRRRGGAAPVGLALPPRRACL